MLPADHERRRFTVDEVARTVDAGVLGEDEPLELIEGELIVVPPQGPEHAERVTRLNMLLAPRYVGRADVRVQCPLDLDATTSPSPRSRSRAISSIAPRWVYAGGGVPIDWRVDLVARARRGAHAPERCGRVWLTRVYGPRDTIALPALGESLPVAVLLGPE